MEILNFLLPFAQLSGIAILLVNFICMYLAVKNHALRIFVITFLAFIIVSGIVYLSIAFYLARYRSILIFLSIFSVIQSAIQYGAILFFYPDVDRKRLQFFTLLAFCLSVCVHAGSLYILDHAPNGPRKTVLRLAEELIEKNKR